MAKYDELKDFLVNRTADRWDANFEMIEGVLGFSLPKSARTYNAWWANETTGTHSHSKAWQDAGWQTSQPNLTSEKVSFFRVNKAVQETFDQAPMSHIAQADTVVGEHETTASIRLDYSWQRLGEVSIDHKDRLHFPKCAPVAGVYLISVRLKDEQRDYIGETDNFSRRLQHYRTPGNSQETNKRLNGIMFECLIEGGAVAVYKVDSVRMVLGDQQSEVALENKFHRRLLENAAISQFQAAHVNLLNR